jgi:hypothetical protein
LLLAPHLTYPRDDDERGYWLYQYCEERAGIAPICSDFLRRNRHSNRVSASRGLRFRETGFRGQRKIRRTELPTITMPSLRTDRRTDPRQFEAFRTPSGNLTVAHDCVVGPGDIAPAVTSMACVSNIAHGRFEPQRIFRALSKH